MAGRTFIVRVSEAPRRVVVEDVRAQRTVLVPGLAAVGPCVARMLAETEAQDEVAAREDSVSAPP